VSTLSEHTANSRVGLILYWRNYITRGSSVEVVSAKKRLYAL